VPNVLLAVAAMLIMVSAIPPLARGTVNDLAVSGDTPRWLSLAFLIARDCGVAVVAGDTQVLPRGHGGALYLAASGIGTLAPGVMLGAGRIRPGDRVLVSGPLGDHGTAILLARHEFDLHGDLWSDSLWSDSASVLPFTQAVLICGGLRFMRDPTRGGITTVANEITLETGLRVVLDEATLPVDDTARDVCERLGSDPLHFACEGRVIAIVDPAHAAALLAEPEDDPLPRNC
jgi:hydrogenase expression/formation protein HypE